MWSWDAAFIATGLASLSVERAVSELDTLLSAQWATGMIPHIVYADQADGYFPGPERWACAELSVAAPAAPASPAGSVKDQLNAVRDNLEASRSLSDAGGSPGGQMTPERLASMSDAEFQSYYNSMPKEALDRVMGKPANM